MTLALSIVPWLTTKSLDDKVSIVKLPLIAVTVEGFLIPTAIHKFRFKGPEH